LIVLSMSEFPSIEMEADHFLQSVVPRVAIRAPFEFIDRSVSPIVSADPDSGKVKLCNVAGGLWPGEHLLRLSLVTVVRTPEAESSGT
jgi:hypothetical protein